MQQENRETHEADGPSLPGAGGIIEAHRAAAENAAKLANAAAQYALSLNRAWLDVWETRLNEYFELPKRVAKAQTDFIEHAFDHYQESLQALGGLALKASDEAGAVVRETQEAGERAAHQFQEDAKDAWSARPKEIHDGAERHEQHGH
jgi:hypothetical protein